MKILLLTSVLPWPLRKNGGAQRTELLRRALSMHGSVDVFAIGGDDLFERGCNWESESEKCRSFGVLDCVVLSKPSQVKQLFWLGPLGKIVQTIQSYRRPYYINQIASTRFRDVLVNNGPYDLIVSRYLSPSLMVGLQQIKHIPKILDFDDIDWLTFKSIIERNPWRGPRGKLTQFLVYSDMKRRCIKALSYFDGIWVTSEEDIKEVTQADCILPNIAFDPTLRKSEVSCVTNDRNKILFVGDLQFPPNKDGLDRFINKVWPLVQKNIPSAELIIVGRGVDSSKAEEWERHAGVSVVGFVDTLADVYSDSAFTIVPVYFGGGTKIKVLESLAYGRTVVAVRESLRGFSNLLLDPPAVACANSDIEFADICVTLLVDVNARESMAQAGLKYIAQHFSYEAFSEVVSATLKNVINKNST
jgi:polysaccharide biosynthesis protein PslH